MSKRLKSTLIASAVTIVWFVLMCVVVAVATMSSIESWYSLPFFEKCPLFSNFFIRLMCVAAVPALFIIVYERLNKEDTSWYKYIIATVFLTVFMCLLYNFGGLYYKGFNLHYNNNIIVFIDGEPVFRSYSPVVIMGLVLFVLSAGLSFGVHVLFGKVCAKKPIVKNIAVFVSLLLFVLLYLFLMQERLLVPDQNDGSSIQWDDFLTSESFIYEFECTHSSIWQYKYYRVYSTVVMVLLTIIPMLLMFFRAYCVDLGGEKASKIKNKIDASVFVNFVPVLATAVIAVILALHKEIDNSSYFDLEISRTVSVILCALVSLAGGFLFLIVYESQRKEKGIIKYVQFIFSQYLFILIVFNTINGGTMGGLYLYHMLDAAIFTAVSLVSVIICLITELKGKPLTQKIVAGVKKLNEKPQGDRVKPERLSEVKRSARTRLGGGIFTGGWLLMALAAIVYSALSGLVAFTLIGAILVIGPITYGLAKTEMNVVTGKKAQADLADIFSGFSECFTQSVVLWLLQTIFLSLWSMLFVVPGIIKYYAYSMAFYVQAHSENKNWRYALIESQRLLYGNKFKLFLLDLSFIGWYILGSACLGIGVLFVVPYHKTARAAFFNSLFVADEKIKQEKAAKEITNAESDTGATACEEAACGETA